MSRPQTSSGLTLWARHILPMCFGPIDSGWIRIQQGRIVAMGRRSPPGSVLDLGDAIVLPGLVNAHTHLEFSDQAQPLSGDGGLPEWIQRVVRVRRARADLLAEDSESARQHTAARIADAVGRGLQESAAAGVTMIGEIVTTFVPDALSHIGPRVRAYRESIGLSPAAVDASHSHLVCDLDRLAAKGIAAGISPHAPYSVAASLGNKLLHTARLRRLPVAMHLAESPHEDALLARGTGPFRTLLENLGVWQSDSPPQLLSAADWITKLSRAARGLVVHGTFLGETGDGEAIARLSYHRDRLAVAICPRTTQLLSGVLPPLARFRNAGIRVAIGTDSRASSPDLSVLAECRVLVDAGLASPEEVLRMATQHAAWAVAMEHRSGNLAIGRPADLAIVRPTTFPKDPYESAIDLSTAVVATLRSGRVIAGELPGRVS